jgi:phospholipase A1/A2
MMTVIRSDKRMSMSKMKCPLKRTGSILLILGAFSASARAQFVPQDLNSPFSVADSNSTDLPDASASDLAFATDDSAADMPSPTSTNVSTTQPANSVQVSGLEASPSSRPSTIPTTTIATQPEESSAQSGNFPAIGGTYGLTEFVTHFAPYEPMYFVGGTQAPNVKFQFSLRYRLFTPTGPLATAVPFFRGFNFAYSQTSFWDLSNLSQPFFYDSSYRPEVFYYLESLPGVKTDPGSQLGFQVGLGHESNGQVDPNHRSLNIVFIRPIVTFGATDSAWFLTLAPKIYDYIGGLPLNPDMPKYRGYADMRVVAGLRDSLQLAAIGRIGRDGNKGSIQLDLTYPLTTLLKGNMDLSLDAQYFYGYGDTLLTYNQRSSIFRFGLALVR